MRNDPFFQPVSGLEMPRFAGMPSFMRLPHLSMDSAEICRVDMGLVGVPWDAGAQPTDQGLATDHVNFGTYQR